MIKVTVLNENTAGSRGFLAEHGLSLLLETEGEEKKRWLFDTGQTNVFLKNADFLGIDLLNLDGIILSHGHFDHCGGLRYLVERYGKEQASLPPVYVRENAFLDKTAVNSDKITYRHIGIPWKRELISEAIHLTKEKEAVAENAWVLGKIPYNAELELWQENFFIDNGNEKIPDYMEDEQIFVLETKEGLNVFAGCCHAGIINCLEHVKRSFPEKRIHSVFAGMHLSGTSRERVEWTVKELKRLAPDTLIPVHCTGLEAIGKLKSAFGEQCVLVETGKSFEIG